MYVKTVLEDKEFNAEFLRMVVPIAFQTLLVNALNILDTLMVGRLGETEISAVGISNQIIFLLQILLYGVGSGAGIFVAQLRGKQDQEGIRKVAAVSLVLGGAFAFLFSLVIFIWPTWIMGLFIKDQAVISLAASYLRILAVSLVFNAVNVTYIAILRSVGEVKLPTQVNLMAFPLKIVLNSVLIFGIFQFAGFGVMGAAFATIITRIAEFVFVGTLLVMKRRDLIVRLRDLLGLSKDLTVKFVKMLGVLVVKDMIWAVGITSYVAVYARMGTEAVVTMNIINVVQQLIMVAAYGTAYASLAMIGHKIGAKNFDSASDYARRFIYITGFVNAVLSALLALGIPLIVSCFNISEYTREAAVHVLYLFALSLPVQCLNSLLFSGILRSGADNRFSLVVDTIAVWVIGFTLIYVFGIVFRAGIEVVFLGFMCSEVFKMVMALRRVRGRNWINNVIEDI